MEIIRVGASGGRGVVGGGWITAAAATVVLHNKT